MSVLHCPLLRIFRSADGDSDRAEGLREHSLVHAARTRDGVRRLGHVVSVRPKTSAITCGPTTCAYLRDRPQICRDYTTDKCEYDNDGVYDQLFETPDQIQEYADALLPPAETWEFSPRAP